MNTSPSFTPTRSKRPVIGITCGEISNKDEPWSPITYGQSRTYIDAIIAAGGLPILLPLTDDRELLRQLCDQLDGLLLAGGNDVNPALYNQEPLSPAETSDYSELRDTAETYMLKQMLAARKPILGICRGMQLLNVIYGGTLYQDIPSHLPDSIDHTASTKLKSLVDLSHELRLDPGSRLAGILDSETVGANAHHHQAIKATGDGVVATAWASDGVIEAVELAGYPYALGVQAHPESLTGVEPRWQQLFNSFVEAAA